MLLSPSQTPNRTTFPLLLLHLALLALALPHQTPEQAVGVHLPLVHLARNVPLPSPPDVEAVRRGRGRPRPGLGRCLQRELQGRGINVLARTRELRVARVVVRHVARAAAARRVGGRLDGRGAEVEGAGAVALGAAGYVSWEALARPKER
jgi:hypothetical protein